MGKEKLLAKEARFISDTLGKDWVVDRILKKIVSAAMHGDTNIIWIFNNSRGIMDEVVMIFEGYGYSVSKLDHEEYVVKIEW